MLQSLFIQNVVLIDKLHLTFSEGLCVLTGETGAGKSILLDALSLALGDRAQTSFIRPGCHRATVAALFKLSPSHPVSHFLEEHGFEKTGELLLRRVISSDGKSRSFLNDQPVSAGLLKQLAAHLVEIHDQFDQLLAPASHRHILDQYAQVGGQKKQVKTAFHAYKTAEEHLNNARQLLSQNQNQISFLQQALAEFKEVSPSSHEEQDLMGRRQMVANHQKIKEGAESVLRNLKEEKGIYSLLAHSLRLLEKLKGVMAGKADTIMQALERATIEVTDAESQLAELLSPQGSEEQSLERIDERLYRLRTLARKQGCLVEELPQHWQKLEAEYRQLQQGDEGLVAVQEAYEQARLRYLEKANELSSARKLAALQLKQEVEQELEPLKLGRAQFDVRFEEIAAAQWSAEGMDDLEFVVQTNPGYPFGGIAKIASGGERSRLLLALKVTLARASQAAIIVFDEIDHAVGGAVAAAIGERLARLGQKQQVLAITHSPQVAAYAQAHYIVDKLMQQGDVRTSVRPLSNDDRRSEIARMLSADRVTDEARAAADSLLKVSSL